VNTNGAPTYSLANHLVGILGSHVGSSPHYVKYLAVFVRTLGFLCARPQDIMASSDVVPFFTREALSLLDQRAGLLPCPYLLLQLWCLVL
jgi:hypothetical protein